MTSIRAAMQQYFYLIHIQYLGFRFHGWAKQPNLKTIHLMIDKTISFVLGHTNFKTLGTSRTDAMVSANHSVFELFLKEPLDAERFMVEFNRNLPLDVRALKIEETSATFNVIQTPKMKEYMYLFSFGEKCHPFCAPVMSSFMENLDIEVMKQGARLFEGVHDFRKYCAKSRDKKSFEREVLLSKIEENETYRASFFPEKSYLYHIHAKGFLRNQIRLMMGQLIKLGQGDISMEQLRASIETPDDAALDYIAPPSGLILHRVVFDESGMGN
ncbi:MAG: tRNA pseudouridine(38-40) synthase TruA [Cyclobacteriaceae bacterium]|nr:tRNA pseudouridine(38-40) synthase TruA [Cyclobacteriaceae bacterium]